MSNLTTGEMLTKTPWEDRQCKDTSGRLRTTDGRELGSQNCSSKTENSRELSEGKKKSRIGKGLGRVKFVCIAPFF